MGVFAGELANVVGGNAGEVGNFFWRILLGAGFQIFESDGVARDVIGVEKVFVDDDVHHAEGERGVCAGINREIPVGEFRGSGAIGIDDDELCAFAAGFFDEGPEMNVGAVNVRGPGDDVTRMSELFGLGAVLAADD